VVHKIIEIALPLTDRKDSFCWRVNSSGEFSTKSATWLAHDTKPYELQGWHYR